MAKIRMQLLQGEAAVMATVVHYINDTLGDMADIGTVDYDFDNHSKHWSEAKGFAFCPQFNPRSPMTSAQFEQLHAALGDAPALPGDANVDDYEAGLIEARTMIGEAYGFDSANVEAW